MSKIQAISAASAVAAIDVQEVAAIVASTTQREADLTAQKDPFYVQVTTCVPDKDVTVDSRVCDMYNFQSRKWLTNHQFWAMHQGHKVEIHPASSEEVDSYTAKQTQLLSRRYGK